MKCLYKETPLILSHALSRLTSRNIYLKMEALQPSGSFKDRGIGTLCEYYANQKVKGFISSSGGNAGMAVAYAGQKLGIAAQVIIPKSTPSMMVDKISAEGAQVVIFGDNWNQADEEARFKSQEQHLAYIPPFDHPMIWQGYGSIIKELKKDKIKPDAIVLAVGGGGLFSGLVHGLRSIGWHDVAIITAETEGAASFAGAMEQNERIKLSKINTVAVTLGAKQICQEAFDLAHQHPVFPQIVSDQQAVSACLRFAQDHRLLVEPACGAALAVAYEQLPIINDFHHIVIIVCGGSGVNLELLEGWKKQFGITLQK